MNWLILLFAACMEIVGVIGLKLFSIKKSVLHFIIFIGGFTLSYAFLYKSLEFLNMSIAYAIWAGIGTAGAVIINIVFFHETKSTLKVISVILVIIGVVGLKLSI